MSNWPKTVKVLLTVATSEKGADDIVTSASPDAIFFDACGEEARNLATKLIARLQERAGIELVAKPIFIPACVGVEKLGLYGAMNLLQNHAMASVPAARTILIVTETDIQFETICSQLAMHLQQKPPTSNFATVTFGREIDQQEAVLEKMVFPDRNVRLLLPQEEPNILSAVKP